MADLRTLAAAVLGVAVGVLCLAFPGAVIRVQTAGRLPSDRRGEYGEESPAPARWRRLVQGIGVVVLAFGVYFGATALGVSPLA